MVERVVERPFALENLIGSHKDLLLQEVISLRLHLVALYCEKHVDQSHIRNLSMVVQSKTMHVHVSEYDVLLVQVAQY